MNTFFFKDEPAGGIRFRDVAEGVLDLQAVAAALGATASGRASTSIPARPRYVTKGSVRSLHSRLRALTNDVNDGRAVMRRVRQMRSADVIQRMRMRRHTGAARARLYATSRAGSPPSTSFPRMQARAA